MSRLLEHRGQIPQAYIRQAWRFVHQMHHGLRKEDTHCMEIGQGGQPVKTRFVAVEMAIR